MFARRTVRGDDDRVVGHVTVDGHRIRFLTQGSGPDLLLINGLAANLETWDPLLPHLAGFRVLAFDAPGVGLSAAPRRPLRPSRFADLAVGLMAALDVARADVLGFSLGGAVAQELARRHPARVRRLVLAATSPGLGAALPGPVALTLLWSPLRFLSPHVYGVIAPALLGGRMRTDRDLRRAYVAARRLHPPTPRAYVTQLLGLAGWSSLPWLHQLRQPTLILAGDDDPLVPTVNARLLARRIHDARLMILPGAGHLFLLTDPATSARVIRRFLTAS